MKKKILCSVLIASLSISSLCGCSQVDAEDGPATAKEDTEEEVTTEDITADALETAEVFADGVISCDLDAMSEVCDDGFSAMYREWSSFLTFDDVSSPEAEEHSEVLNAIRDTMSYTIDTDSVEMADDEIYVGVTFYIADYDTAYDNADPRTAAVFIEDLSSADILEYETTVCLREDNGELLGCNYRRTLNMLYPFASMDLRFDHPLDDFLTGDIEFLFGNEGLDGRVHYRNPVVITVSLETDDDYSYGYTGLRCEVTRDGELLYTFTDSNYLHLYCANIEPDNAVDLGFIIPSGEYTFTFYTESGEEIDSDTCVVETESTGSEPRIEWWEYNGQILDEDVIYDREMIHLTLTVDNIFVGGLDYTVVISHDGEVFYENTFYGDTSITIRADEDPYYPRDDSNTFFASGEYTVTYYDVNGNVIATDTRTLARS